MERQTGSMTDRQKDRKPCVPKLELNEEKNEKKQNDKSTQSTETPTL